MKLFAVTPGDPEGIGPEVVWKTIQKRHSLGLREATLVCVGARAPFEKLGAPILEISPESLKREGARALEGLDAEPRIVLIAAPDQAPRGRHLPGFQSGWSIETATRLVRGRALRALVTGPISKERLQKGGYRYPGHTEFLAKLCGAKRVTMMLANADLRVSLVTTHLPLQSVSRNLSAQAIIGTADQTLSSLKKWWGIRTPRIAVLALNPHAGESGLLGKEEQRVIAPALSKLQRKYGSRARISGPHPADTFFAQHIATPLQERHDAVVAMYHDQGLIPVKLLDFARTVNVTLGLPIVRTSVDHGTGFDIAGRGIADPSSFEAAVELATQISGDR